MREPVYVLGGYQTDFAKVWSRQGQDISDITREATLGALAACELDAASIASIHVGNAFGELQRQQAHLGAMVAQVVPELWGVPAMRHEGACAILIEQLRQLGKNAQMSPTQRREKSRIMQQILRNDAQVRLLTEPWVAELDRLLRPALVGVAKGGAKPAANSNEAN